MKNRILTKDLLLLCFAELWDRFIFYGTLTFLLLFLTENLHFSLKDAYSFWGLFIGLAYLIPFAGGFFADRFLGFINSTLLGGYTLGLGCLILAVTKGEHLFFIGIAIMLLGFGFYKSNLINLVGMLYPDKSAEKDQAYTFFFMWMSIGAISGPIIFGLCIKYIGWHAGFYFCTVGILLACVLITIKNKKMNFISLPPKITNSWYLNILAIILFIGIFILLNVFIYFYDISNALIGVTSGVLFLSIIIYALRCGAIERKKIITLVILIMTTIVYYASSLQIDGSLLLMIKQYINHTIFGWTIPVTFFSSLEGIFVLIISPMMILLLKRVADSGHEWSAYTKVALGLLFAALTFLLYGFSALTTKIYLLPILLIVIGTMFLSLTDIFEIPIVMSTVSRYAPTKLKGVMMGLVLLCNSVAGYIASKMGSLTAQHGSVQHNEYDYFVVFMWVVGICIVLALMLLFFRKKANSNLESVA